MKRDMARLLGALVAMAVALGLALPARADNVTDWPSNGNPPSGPGSYKLTSNVTISSSWEIADDITLDLGGYTFTIANDTGVKRRASIKIASVCSNGNDCIRGGGHGG